MKKYENISKNMFWPNMANHSIETITKNVTKGVDKGSFKPKVDMSKNMIKGLFSGKMNFSKTIADDNSEDSF